MSPTPGVPPTRPIDDSYVVPGTRLMAGEYPGSAPSTPREKADAKLLAFLRAGVDVFVDLTDPADRLEPYHERMCALAGDGPLPIHLSLPIRDMDVADAATMSRILDVIDAHLDAGRTVYVHCWGGVGRTGTVVGCWLVRHGSSGPDALDTVARLFAQMSAKKRHTHRAWGSPQTDPQRSMVHTWAERRTPAPDRVTPSDDAPVSRQEDRLFPLAREGPVETWLDLQTGRLLAARAAAHDAADGQRTAGGLPVEPNASDPAQSGELIRIVAAALDEHGLVWTQSTPASIIARMSEMHAVYDMFFVADDAAGIVMCYCPIASRVPAARRAAVADAIARANYGMRLGCFELDLTDGEVRYRTAVDLLGAPLQPATVMRLMGVAVHCTEQYHDALMRVAFGDADPETAIAEAEQAPE